MSAHHRAMKITRRRLLGTSAGIAAGGLVTAAGLTEVVRAATSTATQLRGLVGSTVPNSARQAGCYYAGLTPDQADARWEAAVGRHMSVTKKYNETSVFPTDLTVNNIDRYIARRVKVCISFKPSFSPLSAVDKKALDTTLALYKSKGLNAEITLWQEPGNAKNNLSPAQYQALVQYYGPTVRKYNFPLVANLNYADLKIANFTDYAKLVTDLVDKYAIDYYYNNFGAGHPLDPAATIADGAGLPFGIWECSTAGPDSGAPDHAAGMRYMNYLLSFMRGRLGAGRRNADVIWYDGDCSTTEPNGQPGPILTSSDYRVPLYQKLWDDLSSAA